MKEITSKNANVQLNSGFETLSLHLQETMCLTLNADKGTSVEMLITYDGTQADLHIDVNAADDCELRLLFWSEMNEPVHFELTINAQTNSKVHIGIADLQAAEADYRIKTILSHEGAEVNVTSACLAYHKHWLMNMEHQKAHTSSLMKNFAVTSENGDYRMEACGAIQKGAYECSSHQTSRVLTMSDNHQCEVTPLLLIDENEVKASHATAVGQPDEGQLYYLKSRGLSTKHALGLLKLSYLLPITEVISDAQIQKQLRMQIEEKVMKHD